MMDPVVHFEMPYDYRERMAKYYESVFGRQRQKLGEEMGNYTLVTTTKTGERGPKKPARLRVVFTRKNPIGLRNIFLLLSHWMLSKNPSRKS